MALNSALPDFIFDPTLGWKDYALLDSGDGKTLERFGPYTLIRPEAQAIWPKSGPTDAWKEAHALRVEESKEYGGRWQFLRPMEKSWEMDYKGLRFQAQLASSRHLGVFPEQAPHWDFITQRVKHSGQKTFKVLNLFGYTGMASLAALKAGAEVVHVDSSKHAISWAAYNLKLNGLSDRPIRWISEDALKFVEREARRGNTYQGIILDPPKFGRGANGQVWDFFKKMPDLVRACRQVLAKDADFVVLTAYAIAASATVTWEAMNDMVGSRGIKTMGELVTQDQAGGRLLSHALFTRWQAD